MHTVDKTALVEILPSYVTLTSNQPHVFASTRRLTIPHRIVVKITINMYFNLVPEYTESTHKLVLLITIYYY